MPTIDQLEELLRAEPDDPFLHFGLAMALRSAGRNDEALAEFDRTLDLDSDYVAAHFHKGQLLAALDREDEARAALRAGIARAAAIGDEHARREMTEYLEGLG